MRPGQKLNTKEITKEERHKVMFKYNAKRSYLLLDEMSRFYLKKKIEREKQKKPLVATS